MKCWINEDHIRLRCVLLLFIFLFISFVISAKSRDEIDSYKAVFTAFPKHTPSEKAVDAPITGNGDIGLSMAPTEGKINFYVGKNDFWKAVASKPDGTIALPGGLSIYSDFVKEKYYVAEQLPGSAELHATFKNSKGAMKICAWVPACDNKIIIEIESSIKTEVNINLWVQDGSDSKASSGLENGCAWVHRSFDNLPYLQWPTYMAMAMNNQNGELLLQPGKKETIVVAIYTNHDTEKWHEKAMEGSANATAASIEAIRQEHREWWDYFWGLSSVSFDDDFLEKYYYQSQYIFACASREGKFAPGIFGPFITTDEPAWCGDYHLNYNFEAPYWASYSSNHICLTENYDEPMLAYMDQGRVHAKNLFNCRGVLYPVGVGPKGLCTSVWPRDKKKMMDLYGVENNSLEDGVGLLHQKTNASFAAANMMMRFYSTYDINYAQRVYPFVKACAEFWQDYMAYENGRYVVKNDAFNEHYPWHNYQGDDNSILSLGLIKMVFKGAEELSSFIKVDRRLRNRWKLIRKKISDYPTGINSQGRLSFRQSENEGVKASGINRIHIHGLLLPTGMTGPNLTPEYNEIMLADMKGWYPTDERDWGASLGNGIETVYPAAARIGYPAKGLLKQLKNRIRMGSYSNCYIVANGGGLETTSAVPCTINEMMMQSYEGIIRIFPNWDKDLNGSFNKLRAYGAFLVSSSIKDGVIGPVTIKSEQGRHCKMENPWPGEKVVVKRNGKNWKSFTGRSFEFNTKKEDVFEIFYGDNRL